MYSTPYYARVENAPKKPSLTVHDQYNEPHNVTCHKELDSPDRHPMRAWYSECHA